MNKEVEKYKEMATFLAASLGKQNEVVLIDLTEENYTIVCRYNRIPGTKNPLKEEIRTFLKDKKISSLNMISGHPFSSTHKRLIKTSIKFIKENDKIVGALCLNMDVSMFIELTCVLEDMVTFNKSVGTEEATPEEVAKQRLFLEPTFDAIDTILSEYNDPKRLDKEEKNDAVIDLYNAGVFELKGAVPKVAEAMNMSQQSIYRYVSRIRKARGE